MTEDRPVSRRAFLGGTIGAVFGFLNSNPETDTSEEIVEKIGVSTAFGAGIGAASAVGDRVHRRVVPPPSDKEIKRADEEAKRKGWHFWQNRSAKRYERQRDDNDKGRGA